MTLAMLLVGLLFGVALSITAALFAVLGMGGHFRRNLRAARVELRRWLTGRNRRTPHQVPVPTIENETQIRSLREEIRVMQRMLDQARVEREAHKDELQEATGEIAALRVSVSGRSDQLAAMETALRGEAEKAVKLREEMAALSAELARSKREARDLETEISLLQSSSGMSAISDEIARLSAERDQLTARLERLTRPIAVAK